MCTIVIKAFKSLKAITKPQNISNIYHQDGVNIKACTDAITATQSLALLSNTYTTTMPQWLTKSFFTPDLERHILDEHLYCDDSGVRHMRTMDGMHLINFIELQLKSKEGFATAYDIALAGGLKDYLKRFVVVQPGDWPSQFYGRQIIYEYLKLEAQRRSQNNLQMNILSPSITSIIPTMGPLHISLNSREHIFITFKPFFKKVYNHLFPGCKLAEKPKPWRINLILEIVYGGWTLIRTNVKTLFQYSKDFQYGTLLNLLDNYLPLVLSIYTITFKTNNFKEYYNAMRRIWVMFVCLKRLHYNKAPLVWLSCVNHWQKSYPDLYNHFCKWPTLFDEYPVENTHSIFRAQKKPTDTPEKLTSRAKSIFESKQRQVNFRSIFTPPRQFNFCQQQLQFLKVKCAQFLTSRLLKIHGKPGSASMSKEKKTHYVCLPDVFGMMKRKCTVLPLGFNSNTVPNENCKCDQKLCKVDNQNGSWQLFHGCWHSFHKVCLNHETSCPLCKQLLAQKVQELGLLAKEAILNPKDDTVCETSEPTESEISEHTDDTNTMKSPNVPECINTQEINETVKDLNSQISSLKAPVEPSQHHAKPNQHYGEWKQHHASPTVTPQPSNKESLLQNTIFQEKILPSKKTSKLVPPQSQNRVEVVTRTDHQGVTEWYYLQTFATLEYMEKP